MAKAKPKIPPSVAGMMGADGGGWNLIKKPKSEDDLRRIAELKEALFRSGTPEDMATIKSLSSLRDALRIQQAQRLNFLLAVSNCPAYQEAYAEYSIMNPGEHQKIVTGASPKEANIEVHDLQERVMRVEYSSPEQWLKTITQDTLSTDE